MTGTARAAYQENGFTLSKGFYPDPGPRAYCGRLHSTERSGRPLATEVSCLLEGVGHLKDTEIVAVAAHDLDADRQSVSGEARGHGNRRTERRRDPVRRLHPGDVVIHFHSRDLFGPIDCGVEGRQLVYRAEQERVLLLESSHPVHELALTDHRPGYVATTQSGSGLDFGDGFGLHLFPMLLEQWSQRRPAFPSANREQDLISAAQIRAGFLNDAAESLEGLALRFQH